jgi:hypothetical protein
VRACLSAADNEVSPETLPSVALRLVRRRAISVSPLVLSVARRVACIAGLSDLVGVGGGVAPVASWAAGVTVGEGEGETCETVGAGETIATVVSGQAANRAPTSAGRTRYCLVIRSSSRIYHSG